MGIEAGGDAGGCLGCLWKCSQESRLTTSMLLPLLVFNDLRCLRVHDSLS